MLDHHIQRSIVYKLALSQELRFSELKPDDIESKLFTYHLKKVVSAGYVEKIENGSYSLTPEGRLMGVNALKNSRNKIDRAYSVLLLIVRRKHDGAWLLYRRKHHPLIGKIGFPHSTPNASEESIVTAQNELRENTGVQATFKALGGGYFRNYEGDELESFIHFTLLVSEDAEGELKNDGELAEYFWQQEIDLTDTNLLENMPILLEVYKNDQRFFIEKAFYS